MLSNQISNFYKFVYIPFDPDLPFPSNPYKTGERAGLALTRFPQVLANLFKLNAHYRVSGTLS